MAKHNLLGKQGEEVARQFLITKGYTIRETNWRCGNLEIDIVAEAYNRIIIVEVKTRKSDLINPALAINKKKIANLVKAANAYIAYNRLKHEIQFDVLFIIGNQNSFKIEHIPDAFRPAMKYYR